MLRLNLSFTVNKETIQNCFNTSHVTVKFAQIMGGRLPAGGFNTSHVTVKFS